jgi:5'-nucleotidase
MLASRLALVAALAGLAAPAQAFTLDVIHLNDMHSRVESVGETGSTCPAEDEAAGECLGGAARVKTAIAEARAAAEAKGEPSIVLFAGDQFSGSLFFTTYQGQAEVELMNAMGFDAMALGNHEFDLGPEPLAKFVEKAEFPVLFGNVDAATDPRLGPLQKTGPLVLEVGGEKVGIVALTTTETPEIASPGPTVVFKDELATLNAQVAELQAQGVKYIIALTHLGDVADVALAAAAAPGIDAIVGGHSHTLFSNTAEGAAHPYPLMAEGQGGVKIPIVQAGEYSKYLGDLRLVFDDEGVVTEATGDVRLLDASVIPDAAMATRVQELAKPIEELKNRVVAEVGAGIDGSRETCRAVECQMGNLVSDAMLDRVKGQGVTIAFQNGGGLRASIDAGAVTQGEILTVLPFQNTLATFNLTGQGVIAALENGVSQVEEGAGRFLQVAGLTYAWDPKAAPGDRIREVMVQEGEVWMPIDPAKTYALVTNDFVRRGGDGFAVLRDQATNAYDFGPGLENVLADYLAAHPGYMPYTDGRISQVK